MLNQTNRSDLSLFHSVVRQWHTLPKPLLFGIYGATGGLLGVLLIGEILWFLTRPAAAQTVPLAISISSEVTVYFGEKNTIGIKIARNGFSGPVVIEGQPLDGVEPLALEIPEGSDEADLTILANQPDEPNPARVVVLEVTATAPGVARAKATASVEVHLKPLPASLHMTAPSDVRVYEGGTNHLTVKLLRQNFAGRVRLLAAETPAGISVDDVVVPAGANEAVLTVAAKGQFEQLPYRVQLRGEYEMDGDVKVELPTKVWVDRPAPFLAVAVSPQVVLFPAHKNKFNLKIVRQGFSGPVAIEVAESLPPHLQIAPIVIAADQTEGEMEASATDGKGADFFRDYRFPIRATAQIQARRALGAGCDLNLRIEPVPPLVNFSISPEVGVTQGGKGVFTVKLARRGFEGPVRLQFSGAPAGTEFPEVVVPADKTQAEVTMIARRKATVGKKNMTAYASADDLAKVRTTVPFVLDVRPYTGKLPEVDIVFVLDVTGSMSFAINGVRGGIKSFVEQLKNEDLDYRIGLFAFRDLIDDRLKEPTKLLMFDGQPFTTDVVAFNAEVAKLRAKGGGDIPEHSMEATVTAANLPFRPGASKILILITDAPPKKGAVKNAKLAAFDPMVNFTKKVLTDSKIDQLHLVVSDEDHDIYALLQEAAKGKFFSIQKAASGKQRFEELMPMLSKEIVGSTTLTRSVPVVSSKPPAQPQSGMVTGLASLGAPVPVGAALPNPPEAKDVPAPEPGARVTPPAAPRPVLQAIQATQTYARESRWQLVGAIGLWTATMAGAIALFLAAGQRLYISRSMLGPLEFVKAGGGGVLAGWLAGAAGQLVFDLTAGGTLWTAISRAFAWGLLGGCLGAGMGLFVPNLHWKRSMVGGAIGGVLGAIAFTLLSLLAGAIPGRWLGAAIVGFFIGIMVAFAEIAFRRVWLEIAFGKWEVRTVSLGARPVLVGADAGRAAVVVESDPPITFSFRSVKGRVLCQNLETGQTVAVHSGEQRNLGRATITLRSSASARRARFTLELSDGRSIPLMEGLPLTAGDLPGLVARGKDRVVLCVGAHPRDPNKLLLQNRSSQTWTVHATDGTDSTVAPGQTVPLAADLEIQFGETSGRLVDSAASDDD